MPYRAHVATTEWTALPNTVADTRYTVQNLGDDVLYVATAAAQPDADTFARGKLVGGGVWYPTPESGESVWVKVPAGGRVETIPVSYVESG